MYFLVKKPEWLGFHPVEYGDEEVRGLQVRHRASQSNTKLVKFEDGSWYLKNGSQLFFLKSISLNKRIGVGTKEDHCINVDSMMEKKWFIRPDGFARDGL